MKIYLRIPKGWSHKVLNRGKETCDLCGAKLWVDPGNRPYCEQEHDPAAVATLPKPAEKIAAIRF